MPRDRQAHKTCPTCHDAAVNCTYNLYEQESLRIDSWEHRCTNCPYRETRAVRSDIQSQGEQVDPTVCPFCGRRAPQPSSA